MTDREREPGAGESPLLQVKNLSLGIERGSSLFTVVEDLSFELMPGEILGIVGESGCGKSLTALSILGLLPPPARIISGSIVFDDREVLGLSPVELRRLRGRDIAIVFQEPFSSLNPLMRVGRQIAEALKLRGERDRALIRRRVLEIMTSLGLPEAEKLYHSYPHQLSGGMCQRVMIALAIICRPRLLIADEPTTALDPAVQAQLLELLEKINRELGSAILLISHDLRVIKRLCRRALVMYAGRILERGPTEKVLSAAAHEYTRGLLLSIPSREMKGRALSNIPGKVPSIEEGRPRGCPFSPRCPRASGSCFSVFPEERDLGGGHRVNCPPENPS